MCFNFFLYLNIKLESKSELTLNFACNRCNCVKILESLSLPSKSKTSTGLLLNALCVKAKLLFSHITILNCISLSQVGKMGLIISLGEIALKGQGQFF